MTFSQKELAMIQDCEFLRTKIIISAKVSELLAETRASLKTVWEIDKLSFTPRKSFNNGKISKGDNYLGLPYQVLDFPATFSQNNAFAFRTMFWWGNFFSATLHLEGAPLDLYRNSIRKNFSLLTNQNIFIGVGDSPWQYHYELDNYEPLTANHTAFIDDCKFLKLSIKLDLDRWQELPSFSSGFFKHLLHLLSDYPTTNS